jgi:short-subunit dehydrogenase
MKKVALITGASAGMGKETVKTLLKNGYTVYGAARRVDKMQDLKALGAKILEMDVADDASMVSGVDAIIKQEGRIDVLVNNAGFGHYGAVEDVSMADAKYQFEVNVFGLARLTQLVLPCMRKQQYGKIVNVTSVGGKIATPLGSWYYASKFAVEALSDSLRLEVKGFGIDVVVIEPGGIKTEWQGIADNNMQKVSGKTAYGPMAAKASKIVADMQDKFPGPQLIADLILKAITTRNPKARYSAGYLARPMIFIKWLLSDSMFDKLILSQMK